MNVKVFLSDLHGIYVRVQHFCIARAAFSDINWQSGIKKKRFYLLHVYHFMTELKHSSFEGLQLQLGSTETYFFSRYQVIVGFMIVDWR